jgi:hypothetical protein
LKHPIKYQRLLLHPFHASYCILSTPLDAFCLCLLIIMFMPLEVFCQRLLMHPVHASWCSLSTPFDASYPRLLMHPFHASWCILSMPLDNPVHASW